MGQFRFLSPRPELLGQEALARAYLVGLDEVPWRTRITTTPYGLTADRNENDSCCLVIPWQLAGRGHLALATSTLMERDEPYHLPVELARGALFRLRNHIANWESLGLEISPAVRKHEQQAVHHFSLAAMGQASGSVTDESQASLESSLAANDALVDDYIAQSLSARRKGGTKLPTLWGAKLGPSLPSTAQAAELQAAFNTLQVAVSWGEVEASQGSLNWQTADEQVQWSGGHGARTWIGPLLQLTADDAPHWLSLWDGEFERLLSFVTNYLQAAVDRFRGKVSVWHVAAGLNRSDALHLHEEQQLRLAAQALEALRVSEPKAPVILSVDQPWAEYMGRRDLDISPLHFADALARADLGLSGLGLEMRFGFDAGQTLLRDWLEISRQLDRWTALGMPLVVLLAPPDFAKLGLSSVQRGVWLQRLLGLLLAKPAIQAVIWTDLSSDSDTRRAIQEISAAMREQYLS